jgi:hypothetical protein
MSISDTSKNIKQQTGSMVDDIASEVKHEVHNIRYVKEPVDPTQSDQVVRRHVTGISISFFILIAIFLVAVIAGVAIYEHSHRAPQTPSAPTTSLHLERTATAA